MKQKVWERVRRKLKIEFERAGIVTCEVCGSGMFLSFAHAKKRRFITDEESLKVAVLLCQTHHEEIEYSGHENMERAITAIIARRNSKGLE